MIEMFAEVKSMLTFVNGDDYDEKIAREIKACVVDLTATAEIVLPGEVEITITKIPETISEPERLTITDNTTWNDDYVNKVIAVWVDKELGNPPNKDQLEKAYRTLKGNMRTSNKYTNYGGGADE